VSLAVYDAFDLEAAVRAQPSSEIDLDVGKVVLDVVSSKIPGLDTRIDQSIVDGSIERTIEGASTLRLTLHDPKRALLKSGMFAYEIQVTLDKLKFALCKVGKSEDDLTLTFEDAEVAALRKITAPKKAARSAMTRAEFAYSIVREVKPPIPFFCPELHVTQPIEKTKQAPSDVERKVTKKSGIAPKSGTSGSSGGKKATKPLTVKGATASAEQKRNGQTVLDVASSLNAPEKAAEALIEACIVESLMLNLSGGDRDSRGILQVRDSTAKPMGIDNRDVAACANAFLTKGFTGRGGAIDLARKNPGMTSGQIAQAVQGSAYPAEYDKRAGEAREWLAAYSGKSSADGDTIGGTGKKGTGSSGKPPPPAWETQTKTTVTVEQPYQYRRGGEDGKTEDSWSCINRLAEEVNWRCFMSAGVCYFISEPELLKAKPSMVLTETTAGVDTIDFDIDGGKVKDEVTVKCRASRWLAAPGAAVELANVGPADGRWLVSSLSRGLFDAACEVKLHRASKAKAEEAATTEKTSLYSTSSSSSKPDLSTGKNVAGAAAADDRIAKVYQAAQAMHAKRYPYRYGGGHGSCGTPSGGKEGPQPGFDCSSSTCAILAAGELGYSYGGRVDVSGTMGRSWGAAGRGKYMTVWANDIHVWVMFHGVGKPGDEHFGTGDWGKGWTGAGFNPNMHHTNGFTARHWWGL
jgi:hypothetical protein